jgi:hypothetical protein
MRCIFDVNLSDIGLERNAPSRPGSDTVIGKENDTFKLLVEIRFASIFRVSTPAIRDSGVEGTLPPESLGVERFDVVAL